jgi:hypothetical protein
VKLCERCVRTVSGENSRIRPCKARCHLSSVSVLVVNSPLTVSHTEDFGTMLRGCGLTFYTCDESRMSAVQFRLSFFPTVQFLKDAFMPSFNDFANETVEEIYVRMDLTTLICSRCVCQRWRSESLVVSVDPTRKALYELYLAAMSSTGLKLAESWIRQHLVPFDRKEYLNALYAQHHHVPAEFRMWLLEWPAKAAIGFI